ncbi:MFS general substrate transporter [Karstenula rhodostoma CBS 690.94]|uniref:MFS general substrate transporter n=1 Tax=Karstenula rhodostoma CBS 690.94 TaxID=1392251 RepID=A0A9P4PY64_9PLEO|nr:MFS general substrate transporter [Karstenula rhodostoma CBS 690.94]
MAAATLNRTDERTPLLAEAIVSSADGNTAPLLTEQTSSDLQNPDSRRNNAQAVDEETGISGGLAHTSIRQVVLVLLIGVFISNADGSILLAVHPTIASEFDALHDSSWLLTSFGLAAAAMQPIYGKMSDIYGRKPLLLVAYVLFAAGCAVVGVAQSMKEVILGRIISGLGASGMTALVSILITDLVPLRDVATWRSYVNIAATTGRSIGGPLGGWLADTVGWRWSMMGQSPAAAIAIILIATVLPSHTRSTSDALSTTKGSKLARIDFLGSFLTTLTILCFLLPLQIGGDRLPWSHPAIFGLLGGACISAALFVLVEAKFAREPVIPLLLFRNKDVVLSALIMMIQGMAQMALMFAIPLYFQVTTRASNTVAGAHLFPAVAGNAVGGLLAGAFIKRTGRYKTITLLAILSACGAYLLLILRWHGHTNWLESLYIIPGGFAMGVAGSTLFISVQASIDPAYSAVAASTLYLAANAGGVIGMASSSAVLQGSLRLILDRKLDEGGFEGIKKLKIIERAVSDVHYAEHAKPAISHIVVASYVDALTWTHVLSLACSILGFISTAFLTQHKL